MLLGMSCGFAAAEEPAEQYLQALRERGFFDAAIHYLDGVKDSDVVSEDFKKRAEFEKAKILIDSVSKIRSPEEQDSRLNQADTLMASYAAKVSDPLKVTEVLKLQANVKYLRGRNNLTQIDSGKVTGAARQKLLQASKKLLGDAIPNYRKVQASQREQIENYQIDPLDSRSDEKLRALQASFVDTRLKIPMVMEKFALSYGDDIANRNAKLAEAAVEFEAVAELYDQRFVQGQMARAFAAGCYQQAADYGAAAEQLKQVFDYPRPAKVLVVEGLKVGVEVWPNLEPYPVNDVIKAASEPVSLLTRRQKSDPTWLRIQLELARAKHQRSIAIKDQDSGAASDLKREATRLAREVAQRKNPHSQLAADLLKTWGVSIEAASVQPIEVAEVPTATSFDDARQKAKDLVEPLSQQLQQVAAERRKLKTITEAVAKSDQERLVDKLQASVDQRSKRALALLSQAVQFSNKDTPRADFNNIRYLQAYCHYSMRRFPEAAVIGKFLLEKYPTIDWSQQAAALAVRSYEKMFDDAPDADRETAKRKVIDAAGSMMSVWPDSSESAGAAVSATRVAIVDGDFEAAKEFFQRIPENSGSATRSQLASKIGQQIWSSRKAAPGKRTRQKLTERASEFLQIAFEGSDPASMDFSTAVAALYYVDACRETDQLSKALEVSSVLLQNLDSNPAIKDSGKYRQSVYSASLNCYLAALGKEKSKDADEWISKLKGVIEKMGDEARGDPAAVQNVSRVFRGVARDLKESFDSLSSTEQKQEFANSLLSFFSETGSVATDGKTRLWAGSTLLAIGESLKLDGFDDQAKTLSGQAIRLLDEANNAGFAGDRNLELAYQKQLALAQRGSGDYEASVSSFESILENSNSITLQIEAAKTLLFWGMEKKNAKALAGSMNGRGEYRDPKTKKNRKRIWGWTLLISGSRSNEKLREQYRECQYYSVLCRFRYGQLTNSKKTIASAQSELTKALKRFDDLAVGAWKSRYEQLQRELKAASK